jgi:hypothetical protein
MKIKNFLFVFAILFTFVFILKTPNYAMAVSKVETGIQSSRQTISTTSVGGSSCTILGGNPSGGNCNFLPSSNIPSSCSSISTTISTIIVGLFSVAGLAFFVMLILSGIKIITAGGDKEKIASAQTAIIHAILGIVIVAGSFLIVEIVTSVLGVGGSLFTSNPISSNCSIK